jgi:protein gp37
MGKDTEISWTNSTFNIVWGCTECAPECDNCYARTWAARHGVGWGRDAPRRTLGEKYWNEPRKWDRAAAKSGVRHRVFCSSMADVFEDNATVAQERAKLWSLIRDTPNLDWQLLTKRPGNIVEAMNTDLFADTGEPAFSDGFRMPPNVWVGTTCGHPKSLWRIKALKQIPAVVRFVSFEPLLADLGRLDLDGIDWAIIGGESGPNARPMNPVWARSIRDQCQDAGIPTLFKQWGELVPMDHIENGWWDSAAAPKSFTARPYFGIWEKGISHGSVYMARVGKKAAGRTLDGRTWDQFPTPEPAHA